MKRKTIISYSTMMLTTALLSSNVFNATAQTDNSVGEKLKKLHVEEHLGVCSPASSLMPTDLSIGLVYQFTPRFSAQILSSGQYFVPKNGMTNKYNYAFGLGGGIGFSPFPIDPNAFGVYEIRASFTAPISNSDYKNMGYGIGIYWRGNTNNYRHKLVPLVGVEYRIHDFDANGLKSFNGFYATFGLRF